MTARQNHSVEILEAKCSKPLLSVVIPVRNEAGNIAVLIEEIGQAFDNRTFSDYEIIIVDDGSTDGTSEVAQGLCATNENVCIVQLKIPAGQSAAVCYGVRYARAAWVATLDGDGQNDPADIWKLWSAAQELGGAHKSVLVIGHRIVRMDSIARRVTSWILGRLSATCLRHDVVDKGSGLKVFRRSDFLVLPMFDHMHRFLPGLFKLLDAEIISIPANHRARLSGSSHYKNLARIRQAVVDVVGIMWLQRRFIRLPEEGDGC